MSEVTLYTASSSGAGEEVLARGGRSDLRNNLLPRRARSTTNSRATRSVQEFFDLAGQLRPRGAGQRDSAGAVVQDARGGRPKSSFIAFTYTSLLLSSQTTAPVGEVPSRHQSGPMSALRHLAQRVVGVVGGVSFARRARRLAKHLQLAARHVVKPLTPAHPRPAASLVVEKVMLDHPVDGRIRGQVRPPSFEAAR